MQILRQVRLPPQTLYFFNQSLFLVHVGEPSPPLSASSRWQEGYLRFSTARKRSL